MLNRHGEVFRTLLGASDLALVAASWLAAYGLRFRLGFDAPLGVPEFRSCHAPRVDPAALVRALPSARALRGPAHEFPLARVEPGLHCDSDRCRDPRRR